MLRNVIVGATLLLSVPPISGCTSWAPLDTARPAPRRTPVQVWTEDGVVTVRELAVTADSVSGQGVWPDSGRLVVPRDAVDSLRIQTEDPGKILIIGVAAGIGLLYAGVPWRFF